jgi:hypothetical protein
MTKERAMIRPVGIPVFEGFFRAVPGLDFDKEDLRRFHRYVDEKVDHLGVAGCNTARWNGRDIIAPQELPITAVLQERMREFDDLDVAGEVRDLLRLSVRRPSSDVTVSDETEELCRRCSAG